MRLYALLLLVFFFNSGLKGYAQQVTLANKNISLDAALSTLQQQSGYSFFWDKALVVKQPPVTVNIKGASLQQALDACLKGTTLTYEIKGKLVFIKPRPVTVVTDKPVTEQPVFITGKVFDEQHHAMPGVTVTNGEKQRGTQSDEKGFFKIAAGRGDLLDFSFVGYRPVQYHVKAIHDAVSINMQPVDSSLEAPVVVGYGTQKKSATTGSVAVISSMSIENRPVTNLSSSLAGLAAGVYVRQISGRPGKDGAVTVIRGVGTLSSTVSLVLIDGLIGNIDEVNPYDVESVTILKDASAAAIYGALSSNGVILITTKKPGYKRPVVTYTGMVSKTRPNGIVKTVSDMPTYMTLMNQGYQNVERPAPFAQSLIDQWRHANQYPDSLTPQGIPFYIAYPNTDWAKALIRNQYLQNHNISVKGGDKNVKYFLSFGYMDNKGLIANSGVKRYLARANIEARLTKNITIGTQTFGGIQYLGMADIESLFRYLAEASPGTYPGRYRGVFAAPSATADPSYNIGVHPYATLGTDRVAHINTSWYGKVFLLPGLSFEPRVNYQQNIEKISSRTDPATGERWNWRTNTQVQSAWQPFQLSTADSLLKHYSYSLEALLRYNTSFGQKHHVAAILGANEYYHQRNHRYSTTWPLVAFNGSEWVIKGDSVSSSSNRENEAMRSLFSRLSYDYLNKYFLNFSLRKDGSSRFGPDHRYGTFPGISAAWRLSEEAFLHSIKNRIQELKLRMSYGVAGNTASGDYDWQAIYDQHDYSFGGVPVTGIGQNRLANPNLAWERSSMVNTGLELTAFNHLNLTAEWYRRLTDKILVAPAMDPTAGVKIPSALNLARVLNCGTELSVGWKQHSGAFSWSVAGSAAWNYLNRVEKYKGKLQDGFVTDANGHRVYTSNIGAVSSGIDTRVIEGRQINEYYLQTVYNGTGTYYYQNGNVDPNGGPKDGMIRTPADLNWVKAMISKGYRFNQAQTIAGVNRIGLYYGDLVFADNNGDGIYGNDGDQRFTGRTATPKCIFGLAVNINWKAFDFSMLWAGATGMYYLWNETFQNASYIELGGAIPLNIANGSYYYNDDNPADPTNRIGGTYPRMTPMTYNSSNWMNSNFWLYNASYFKLKNLQLGYTVPLAGRIGRYFESVRFFASGENVLTLTKFRGMDPEVGATANYPTMRQYAFGVNITFK